MAWRIRGMVYGGTAALAAALLLVGSDSGLRDERAEAARPAGAPAMLQRGRLARLPEPERAKAHDGDMVRAALSLGTFQRWTGLLGAAVLSAAALGFAARRLRFVRAWRGARATL
jgi:hypothetical protein